MVRDPVPARRVRKRIAVCVLLSVLAVSLAAATSSGSQLSPDMRIVVLEAGATPDTLRLGVRKRNMLVYNMSLLPEYPDQINSETLDTQILNFNPAACTHLQSAYLSSGTAAPTLYDVFDLQLNPASRSADEQRQFLNAVLASFATSRNVRLYVRNDLCSSSGGRVVAGITVN